MIHNNFFVSKLLSETNCVYQALVWLRDVLHPTNGTCTLKDCIGLHSKDCKQNNTVAVRAKDLKLKLKVGEMTSCFADVDTALQAFANSKEGRCDVHVFVSGRAATIVGPVSPHTMKAKGLFSKFLYWNFIKVGRCLSNGKIATDPAPFVKKMSE